MDHLEGAVAGQRRHLGHRVVQDFDEYASEAEADRGTEQRIVDDAGIGLRDALDHRLDQRAALEAGVARIPDDRRIGVADLLLVRAIQPHAAEVALVQKARGLCLDGDRGAEPAQHGDGFVLGMRKGGIDHRHATRDQEPVVRSENPTGRVAVQAGVRTAADLLGSAGLAARAQ